jgi:hypothetical protein
MVLAGVSVSPATAAVPTVTAIRAQLKQVFAAWDLDGDGFLDKEELAKAFRGARAKPYDSKSSNKDKGTKKSDYNRYPDYLFLVQLDTDKDGKISKKEWTAWAKVYSSLLKEMYKAQDQIAKAQARFQKAKTATTRSKALAKYREVQRKLAAAQKKLNSYYKKLAEAMKKAGKN